MISGKTSKKTYGKKHKQESTNIPTKKSTAKSTKKKHKLPNTGTKKSTAKSTKKSTNCQTHRQKKAQRKAQKETTNYQTQAQKIAPAKSGQTSFQEPASWPTPCLRQKFPELEPAPQASLWGSCVWPLTAPLKFKFSQPIFCNKRRKKKNPRAHRSAHHHA